MSAPAEGLRKGLRGSDRTLRTVIAALAKEASDTYLSASVGGWVERLAAT